MPTAAEVLAVQLQVRLTENARKYLEENGREDQIETLSKWVEYWLDNQARGGFVVTAEHAEYLRTLAKKAVLDSDGVVKLAERAAQRKDGQFSVSIELDPSYIEPLADIAKQQGRASVQEMLQEFVNDVIGEAWGYNLPAERLARFTAAQWAEIEKIVGREAVFGKDIYEALVRLNRKKAA